MREMNSTSFEEFLNGWSLTPEELIGFCTNGGKMTIEKAAKGNNARGISISGLFVFSNQGMYSSEKWFRIRDEWDIIRYGNKEIPFYRVYQELVHHTPLKIDTKEFDEELL